jgi:hypothetical protein
MASIANAEQLGAKRQEGGSAGARIRRYALSSVIITRAATPERGLSLGDGELECSGELGSRLGIRQGVRTGLGNDDHVRRRFDVDPASAEYLAQEPLDARANDRVADSLAHRHTEARAFSRGRLPDDHQVVAVSTSSLALNRKKLGATAQPCRLGVGLRSVHDQPGCLGGIETVNRRRRLSRLRFST